MQVIPPTMELALLVFFLKVIMIIIILTTLGRVINWVKSSIEQGLEGLGNEQSSSSHSTNRIFIWYQSRRNLLPWLVRFYISFSFFICSFIIGMTWAEGVYIPPVLVFTCVGIILALMFRLPSSDNSK